MSDRRSTAALLLGFTVLNLVAVALLAAAYGWPAVLDEPAAVVLPAFVGPATAVVGLGLTAVWGLSFLVGPFAPVLAEGLFGTAGFTAYALWFFWLGAIGLVLLRPARTPVGAR